MVFCGLLAGGRICIIAGCVLQYLMKIQLWRRWYGRLIRWSALNTGVERRSAKELAAGENCEILIWNLGDGMSPGALRKLCGPDTVLVYCADRHWLDCGGDEIGEADEIWELPLNFRCARQRLERLLKQIKLERDLHLCRSYLDTAIDSIPDMVWFKALDGTHVKVNKAFCNTVGKVSGGRHRAGSLLYLGCVEGGFRAGERASARRLRTR